MNNKPSGKIDEYLTLFEEAAIRRHDAANELAKFMVAFEKVRKKRYKVQEILESSGYKFYKEDLICIYYWSLCRRTMIEIRKSTGKVTLSRFNPLEIPEE